MKSIEKVKDYLKEKNTVITYFEIGRLLSEAGGKYGDNFIDKYSKKLVIEVGKKYNRRTLFRMKQFYNVFSNEKVSPLVTQLTWTNCLVLLSIKDVNELYYYANEVKNRLLSKRQLEEIIKNKNTKDCQSQLKSKLIFEEKLEVKDLVPNPILIKNKRNIETATERTLHDLILEDIEFFMKELGNNFSFIGSEYKIKIGDTYHKIDLLLFNIKYNAYVVVELKVTQFRVEYISQVQKYMNCIDENIKEMSNNNTIGILICKKEDKFVIEYCSDDGIAVREYELV
jgi:predicted nuclease of restriction endonuclease-like (RecB) superfamily